MDIATIRLVPDGIVRGDCFADDLLVQREDVIPVGLAHECRLASGLGVYGHAPGGESKPKDKDNVVDAEFVDVEDKK